MIMCPSVKLVYSEYIVLYIELNSNLVNWIVIDIAEIIGGKNYFSCYMMSALMLHNHYACTIDKVVITKSSMLILI